MSTLAWIIGASVAGALLSVISAAAVALRASANQLPMLISYAIGALLGAVFLEILPHAFEQTGSAHHLAAVILGGILFFFVLEKLVLWRHCHAEPGTNPFRPNSFLKSFSRCKGPFSPSRSRLTNIRRGVASSPRATSGSLKVLCP